MDSLNQAQKVVIIGVDGAPYSLLTHYAESGIMPCLAKIMASGKMMPMKSTLPEVSSVAWTSFMTGKQPAEHGTFGFMEIDKATYEYVFPDFSSLKVPTFWETAGLPTIALNIPQTYPARKINGVLVSGFVALDLEKAVYPSRIYRYLKEMDYRLDVRSNLAASKPEAFIRDVFDTFDKRIAAMQYLYDNEPWNIFIGTVTETDRLHHFYFDSAKDGPYHEVFVDFYTKLDKFLGTMFEKSEKSNAVFLTCSDHGFAPIESEVYVNRFLMDNGFLSLDSDNGFTGIARDSKAFCLDPARVYIHTKGKYGRGSVESADYRSVKKEIKQAFDSIEFNGDKAIAKIFDKEEIFDGPFSIDAPDLYLLGNTGFDLKSPVNKPEVFGRSLFKGAHTYEDAHFFTSDRKMAQMAAHDRFSIADIGSLVLNLFQ